MRKVKGLRDELKTDKGFTLVEVLVAIMVGMIVMGMAVAILGSTNSASLRVLAKSEAQQNSRATVVKLLDSLSNAESLRNCRVGKTLADQNEIIANAYRPNIAVDNCLDTVSSGYVLARALPNELCYFKSNGTDAANIKCIARGVSGSDGARAYYPTPGTFTPPTKVVGLPLDMNLDNCLNPSSLDDPRLVYSYDCKPQGGANYIKWSNTYSYKAGSAVVIADLGSSITDPINSNLFSYYQDDGTKVDLGINTDSSSSSLTKVVAVVVNMDVKYETRRGSNKDTFKFNQTIVLRGSNKATQEKYNG